MHPHHPTILVLVHVYGRLNSVSSEVELGHASVLLDLQGISVAWLFVLLGRPNFVLYPRLLDRVFGFGSEGIRGVRSLRC